MIRWSWQWASLRYGFNVGYDVWWEQYARRLYLNLIVGSLCLILRGGKLGQEKMGWEDDPTPW